MMTVPQLYTPSVVPVTFRMTAWRNGSASDSRSEGCVFESRRGHYLFIFIFHFFLPFLRGI